MADFLAKTLEIYKVLSNQEFEPLAKAPLVFDSETHPEEKPYVELWRMQNEHGQGPYWRGDNPVDSSKWRIEPHITETGRPSPDLDEGFTNKDRGNLSGEHRFGFETEDHLKSWFKPEEIEKLAGMGFKPTKVKAKKVWSSGTQAFYEPYTEPEEKLAASENLQKIAKDDESEVASVAVRNGDSILMGKRRDNERWTLPGGHLDKGEDKFEGAVRELFEEAGITVDKKDLKHLGTEKVTTFSGKKKTIHAFSYKYDGERPTTKNDPDKEVYKWEWIDCKDGLPEDVEENLHSPKNKVLQELGLLKKAGYEDESEKIKGNKETSEAKSPHKFKAAHWTHPNGHPRCIICGDEERTGGMCEGLKKSDYGPKNLGLYSAPDNAKRKESRTGEVAEGAGPNKGVRQTKPSAKQQALMEAHYYKQKNKKQPVKFYSPEEIERLKQQMNIKGNKLAASEMKNHLEQIGHFTPSWHHSYLQHKQVQPSYEVKPNSHDPLESYMQHMISSGKLVYHPKKGFITGNRMRDFGDSKPLMKMDEGPIKLVHYGRVPGLKALDPNMQGTGYPDAAMKRRGKPENPVTYYYRQGTFEEPDVKGSAKAKYHVTLDPQQHKLYDLAHDKDKLVDSALKENHGAWNPDMIEGKIKSAGYHGYFHSGGSLPGAVAVFHPMNVEREDKV